MVNYKDIESALVELFENNVTQKRSDVHCRYIVKQRVLNEEVYNEKIADFKDEKVYQSLKKLYKLYLSFTNQEEVVQKRSTEEKRNLISHTHQEYYKIILEKFY
ncbi:16993_t:CDS:2 [Funneliformis caledonium]|uniref:16993_t:CDS:1 n=1 Tax=Funneliformis caledonium TaxID=1117310 RepID=A0A9N9A3K1_9GLOM|nr:16993_t:CDS:2 [Funneliformis caledonium]